MTKIYKTLLALLATGLLSCGLFSQNALAVEGTITFFGNASADKASSDGTNTKITFTNTWQVLGGTLDYAPVPAGTPTTFTDFIFANDDADGGGSAATLVAPSPVAPLWTFMFNGDTYKFDLQALTSGAVTTDGGGNTAMGFTGTGIAYINGVGTAATWGLQGAGRNFQFTFATSSTSSHGVPDGGATVALLGIGLVGIATLRRKLKAV